jgi:hypothetical protein
MSSALSHANRPSGLRAAREHDTKSITSFVRLLIMSSIILMTCGVSLLLIAPRDPSVGRTNHVDQVVVFREAEIGEPVALPVEIRNRSGTGLSIVGAESAVCGVWGCKSVSEPGLPLRIAPGQAEQVIVRVSSNHAGRFDQDVVLFTDQPSHSRWVIRVIGSFRDRSLPLSAVSDRPADLE